MVYILTGLNQYLDGSIAKVSPSYIKFVVDGNYGSTDHVEIIFPKGSVLRRAGHPRVKHPSIKGKLPIPKITWQMSFPFLHLSEGTEMMEDYNSNVFVNFLKKLIPATYSDCVMDLRNTQTLLRNRNITNSRLLTMVEDFFEQEKKCNCHGIAFVGDLDIGGRVYRVGIQDIKTKKISKKIPLGWRIHSENNIGEDIKETYYHIYPVKGKFVGDRTTFRLNFQNAA